MSSVGFQLGCKTCSYCWPGALVVVAVVVVVAVAVAVAVAAVVAVAVAVGGVEMVTISI